MEQQSEPEKPFLLQHLIVHGVLAAVLLVGGWLVPAQYNILHPKVMRQAADGTELLKEFITNGHHAEVQAVLNVSRLKIESAKQEDSKLPKLDEASALAFFINPTNRVKALDTLRGEGAASGNLINLLHRKEKTDSVDEYGTTVILAAQLQAKGKMTPGVYQSILANDPQKFTEDARKGFHRGRLKQILHSLMILGNRLSYEQLAALMVTVPDPVVLMDLAKIAKHQTMVPDFRLLDTHSDSPGALTLDELKGISAIGEPELFGKYDQNSSSYSKGTLTLDEWLQIGHVPLPYTEFPSTYTACLWSGDPGAVTQYLMLHGRRGDRHLQQALNQGKGALALLLERQLPVSSLDTPALGTVANFCYKHPRWALAIKYLLIGLGCLVLMRAWASFFVFTATDRSSLRAYRMRRRAVALALFLTLGALSEPVLFTPVFSSEYQVPISLPANPVDSTETPNPTEPMLAASNHGIILSIIFIVIFAAIQSFVYYACVSKIKDVQNGTGDPRLKLQLLENEDNLFDMGLYVGIAGTALMLAILIIFPKWEISVSAAYASNIFGILCVAVVKIFHVRGTRQMLILEAETGEVQTTPATEFNQP